jgi:hypothetical protein
MTRELGLPKEKKKSLAGSDELAVAGSCMQSKEVVHARLIDWPETSSSRPFPVQSGLAYVPLLAASITVQYESFIQIGTYGCARLDRHMICKPLHL